MKKIYAFLLAFMTIFVQNVCAQDVITAPESGADYMIQHRSGLFLQKSGSSLKIMNAHTGDAQKLSFEPIADVEGAYAIKFEDGTYLGSDNGWTAKFAAEAADAYYQWSFEAGHESGYIAIKNLGRNAYLGTDNNNDGGGVYTNKSKNDGKSCWKIMLYSDDLITDGLQSAIDAAKALLAEEGYPQAAIDQINAMVASGEAALSASTQTEIDAAAKSINDFVSNIGQLHSAIESAQALVGSAVADNAPGCYPQEAIDALGAAIEVAIAAYADPTGYVAARDALNAAVATFNSACYVFFPEEGKKYMLVVASDPNFVVGYGTNHQNYEGAIIDNLTGASNQLFIIKGNESSNSTFTFQYADDERYLVRDGNWNITKGDYSENNALWDIAIKDLAAGEYRIKHPGADTREVGYDNLVAGQGLFHDKWSGGFNVKFVPLVEGEVITIGLETAITKAEEYLAKAKVGDEPGCYPQAAVDALSAAIAAAKAANPTTQAEVGAATDALNAAVAAFLAAKIDPYFAPKENTAYRFSVRKYLDKYLTNDEGSAKSTSAFASGDTRQHITFVPVDGKAHTFIVKNDGKALSYDGNFEEVADADAKLWTAVYAGTYSNYYYFNLVEYDDPSKVLTFSSGNTFVIQNVSAGNNAHEGCFTRVAMPNDPKDIRLYDEWINYGRITVENCDRGADIGQYSDAKCEALLAALAEYEAKTDLTDETVSAYISEMSALISNFIANPNSVIKDEFEAAVAAANAKADSAEQNIGIEVGQYSPLQIKAFRTKIAALVQEVATASEQAEVDSLTTVANAAIDAFVGNEAVRSVKDVIAEVADWNLELWEETKENVGTDQGQRPQELIDEFHQKTVAARNLENPTVEDLEELLDLRWTYIAGAASVSRTALRKAIADAQADEFSNLTGGEYDGNYSQDCIDTFNQALTNAIAVEADMTKTQEEVDAATKALTDAITALRKSLVKINFTALDSALAAAQTALASVTEIGSAAGQCPQAVVDSLSAVIAKGQGVDRAAINQASVDALVEELNAAVVTFRAAVVESTGISQAIANAQALYDAAEEGFLPGNYPSSAMAQLLEAIQNAQTVADNSAATQAELLAAVSDLNATVESFKTQAVPAHDLTELIALIAEVDAYIAANGTDDFILNYAHDAAKDVVANPGSYTAAQVAQIFADLQAAFEEVKNTSGIRSISGDASGIKVVNGKLMVNGIENCVVAVYTLDGRQISIMRGTVELQLSAGKYVVAVTGNGVALSQVVIVK